MQRVYLNDFFKWNLPVDDPNTNVFLEKQNIPDYRT